MPLARLVQCAHMRWCGEVGSGWCEWARFWRCWLGALLVRRDTTARCVRIKKLGLGHAQGAHACP
jgi:hypothetical protein